MPRKQRDHKAEYARAKQLAQERGYASQRQAKRVSREVRSIIGGVRKANKEWSDAHSRMSTSEYHPTISDTKAIAYHKAFVEPIPDGLSRRGKMKWKRGVIHDYMVDHGEMTQDEWIQKYESVG